MLVTLLRFGRSSLGCNMQPLGSWPCVPHLTRALLHCSFLCVEMLTLVGLAVPGPPLPIAARRPRLLHQRRPPEATSPLVRVPVAAPPAPPPRRQQRDPPARSRRSEPARGWDPARARHAR